MEELAVVVERGKFRMTLWSESNSAASESNGTLDHRSPPTTLPLITNSHVDYY